MTEVPTRRGRGTSAGLTREAVVSGAERVVERVGLESSSLRAVALELGVTPGALYSYFANKQELIDAVADSFLAREVLTRLPRKAAPTALLRVICRRLHAAGVAHPALLTAVVGHISEKEDTAQLEIAERMLTSLRAAGVERERAHILYRMLVALCLGNALYDAKIRSQSTDGLPERLAAHAASTRLPETAAYIDRIRRGTGSWFDMQLDTVLAELDSAKP